MPTYILGEVSISGWIILFNDCRTITNIDPGKNWILGDIVVISTSDFIEPLKILVIRHELINPS